MAAALLAAACIVLFFARLTKFNATQIFAVSVLLLAWCAGHILFSQNLYFVEFTLLLPLGFLALAYNRVSEPIIITTLLALSIVNFLCRYEFATVFSFLVVLPVLSFDPDKSMRVKARKAGLYFATTVLGFCIAVAIHIHLVAVDLGIPLKDAPAIAFGNAAMRTMSLEEGVPAPFSFEFLRLITKSLRQPVLSIPHFPILISKMSVVLALVVILVVHIKDRRYARAAIIAWAFVAYLSWFVFAYQHLMVHAMDGLFYDNLLFALTCEICLFSEALRFIST